MLDENGYDVAYKILGKIIFFVMYVCVYAIWSSILSNFSLSIVFYIFFFAILNIFHLERWRKNKDSKLKLKFYNIEYKKRKETKIHEYIFSYRILSTPCIYPLYLQFKTHTKLNVDKFFQVWDIKLGAGNRVARIRLVATFTKLFYPESPWSLRRIN